MGNPDGWGERLPGGNVGGAWRVGNTVRRPTGRWSPAVHALLEHLRRRLDGVPAFHGIDEHGREILDFLPGRIVDVDTEELTDRQLASVAAWTRRLHEATADFAEPDGDDRRARTHPAGTPSASAAPARPGIAAVTPDAGCSA